MNALIAWVLVALVVHSAGLFWLTAELRKAHRRLGVLDGHLIRSEGLMRGHLMARKAPEGAPAGESHKDSVPGVVEAPPKPKRKYTRRAKVQPSEAIDTTVRAPLEPAESLPFVPTAEAFEAGRFQPIPPPRSEGGSS